LDTIVQVTPGYQHRALQDIFAQQLTKVTYPSAAVAGVELTKQESAHPQKILCALRVPVGIIPNITTCRHARPVGQAVILIVHTQTIADVILVVPFGAGDVPPARLRQLWE